MLQASYTLLLLLGLSPWQFQPDKVHQELELLKATIGKTFWELVEGFQRGWLQEQGMQPGLPSTSITGDFYPCVGTLGVLSFRNQPGSCRCLSTRKLQLFH